MFPSSSPGVRPGLLGRLCLDGPRLRRLGLLPVLGIVGVLGLLWAAPLPESLYTPGSPVVRFSDGTTASVALSPDQKWRIGASIERVDPDYLTALVALEDSRFWWHPGVDPVAIVRASVQNLQAGGVVSGASTLTMQLARMLDPRPRTLGSKLIEAVRAVQLELHLSKSEILAAYLTRVPYGRNLEGIEAASLAYFGHDARALSPAEIATLLAVPQNPNSRYPTARNLPRLTAARDDIAGRLFAAGVLGDRSEVLDEARAAPVPTALQPPPRHALHAATYMWARRGAQERLETTLDRGLQLRVEERLSRLHPELQAQGIHNAAVVVIDHTTGEIRALVGNPDFWDREHGGQIIGFDVPRSPGSALKPFLYGLAIDQAEALPGFLVSDVPVRYGSYAPENYDGSWAGMVTLEDALARSLNIPFVNLLRSVGIERMMALLREGGVRSLNPEPGFYGLSMVVGGVEVTPLEVAGLYAALAADGVYREPRWMSGERSPERRILSEGAAWLTRQTLSLRDRPDFPSRRDLDGRNPRIHWKTGTSFGNRDAWAAGSGRTLTAVVWTGNFDRRSSTALVGAEVAAPLLFDLLEGAGDSQGEVSPPPEELVPVQVCRLSGRIPGAACTETVSVRARERRVPTERCALHVEVEVEDSTGLALGPTCRQGRESHMERLVVWPASVVRYLSASQANEPVVPPRAPECEDAAPGAPPQIIHPRSGDTVLLIPGMAADEQEVGFEADASAPQTVLTWFVDGEPIGSGPAHSRVWWVPRAGRHQVVVMDGAGRTDVAQIEVRRGGAASAPRPGG